MSEEVDIQLVLKYLREWTSALVEENAILKARLAAQEPKL